MHLTWNECCARLSAPLVRRGLTPTDATIVAEITVRTLAMGIPTHALPPWQCTRDAIGTIIRPEATPVFVEEYPTRARCDASALAPQVALWHGLRQAMERASRLGVAAVGIHGSGWIGAVGPYLLDAMSAGLPAFVTCQSSACADCAPLGGLDPLLSTNPIGFCYGSQQEGMLADFSTATMAMGRVGQLIKNQKRALEPSFREIDGSWTDDPTAMQRGGSLAFAGGRNGGHRGYALSLWTEAMAALAGGNAHDPKRKKSQNLMITVWAPKDGASFQEEIARFHTLARSNRREDPAVPIRLPGSRALAMLEKGRHEGFELNEAQLAIIDG